MGGILVDFGRKLEKRQYISVALFEKVQKRAPQQIPPNFDLDRYNGDVLESAYRQLEGYFGSRVNKESAKAILADEKCRLIVTGADKTTFMATEIRYLIEKRQIAPKDILVIRRDGRGIEDLQSAVDALPDGSSVDMVTMHALGDRYIHQVLRYKNYYTVSEDERRSVFLKYLKKRIMTGYDKIGDFIECFSERSTGQRGLIGNFFCENYGRFAIFDDYFDGYVEKKLADAGDPATRLRRLADARKNADIPHTILGEQVKTKPEVEIANWLFGHSIRYEYARPFDDLLPDANGYRPDFTIDIGGRKIYIEYLDAKVGCIKEEFHRRNHTNLITLNYEPNRGFLKTLQRKLEGLGIHLPSERKAKDAYAAIIRRDPLAEFSKLSEFFYEIIDTIKTSRHRKDFDKAVESYLDGIKSLDERVLAEKQFKYIRDFYVFYGSEIHRDADRLGFDSADMAYYAGVLTGRSGQKISNYKYIIAEEGQGDSPDYSALVNNIVARGKAKLTIVGTDWRSIVAFPYSNIDNVCNFRNSLRGTKTFWLGAHGDGARSSVDLAGDCVVYDCRDEQGGAADGIFESDPFVFLNYQAGDEFEQTKSAILSIHQQRPYDKIAVVACSNAAKKALLKHAAGFESAGGTKASLAEAPNCAFDVFVADKARRLAADWTIVIGLSDNYSVKTPASYFWLNEILSDAPPKEACFTEEKRAIGLALMRTRYKVILPRESSTGERNSFLDNLYASMRAS